MFITVKNVSDKSCRKNETVYPQCTFSVIRLTVFEIVKQKGAAAPEPLRSAYISKVVNCYNFTCGIRPTLPFSILHPNIIPFWSIPIVSGGKTYKFMDAKPGLWRRTTNPLVHLVVGLAKDSHCKYGRWRR
jgi:hypothetical protein